MLCVQDTASYQDHPHACGDKCYTASRQRLSQGSSPRVWGQDFVSKSDLPLSRIIPTRVGTSDYAQKADTQARDHPHACGDKADVCWALAAYSGSSPRVWGQVIAKHTRTQYKRIIPTRVGTRYIQTVGMRSCGDHPHACGDKFMKHRTTQ